MTTTPAQGSYVEVDGQSIYYQLHGEGPPLVLLHGGLQTIELRAITAPTLVLVGDADFVRVEHAAHHQEVLPDARLAVVPGATHVGLLHETDLVLPLLHRFLDG